jgi:hypothetical protein
MKLLSSSKEKSPKQKFITFERYSRLAQASR